MRAAGKRIRCPKCKNAFQVRSADEATTTLLPEPNADALLEELAAKEGAASLDYASHVLAPPRLPSVAGPVETKGADAGRRRAIGGGGNLLTGILGCAIGAAVGGGGLTVFSIFTEFFYTPFTLIVPVTAGLGMGLGNRAGGYNAALLSVLITFIGIFVTRLLIFMFVSLPIVLDSKDMKQSLVIVGTVYDEFEEQGKLDSATEDDWYDRMGEESDRVVHLPKDWLNREAKPYQERLLSDEEFADYAATYDESISAVIGIAFIFTLFDLWDIFGLPLSVFIAYKMGGASP